MILITMPVWSLWMRAGPSCDFGFLALLVPSSRFLKRSRSEWRNAFEHSHQTPMATIQIKSTTIRNMAIRPPPPHQIGRGEGEYRLKAASRRISAGYQWPQSVPPPDLPDSGRVFQKQRCPEA